VSPRIRLLALLLALAACGGDPASDPGRADASAAAGDPVELAHFPIGGGAVPEGADAAFDPGISRDGGGSLRVESEAGGRLRLYRLGDLGPLSGRLLMTGFLKSRDLKGAAFFEMRCRPAVGNEAFVRGVSGRVEGSSDWKPTQMGFSRPDLCSNPVSVELNVVVDGSGTIWIDDLRLWSAP
jgi:hypothetical protein